MKNIWLKLKDAGITQAQAADKIGISRQAMSSKLRGRVDFKVDEIKKLRDIYFPESSLEELLDERRI